MDQELVDTAAYAPGRRFVCTHQVPAFHCVHAITAAILKL